MLLCMHLYVWWRQEIHRISSIGHMTITELVKILHFIFKIVVRTQNLSREILIFKLLNKKIRISYTSNFIFTLTSRKSRKTQICYY
jgi:hypothetical protein